MIAPAAQPDKQTLTGLHCDRVYFAGGRGLCLKRGGGFAAGYRAEVFGPNLKVSHALGVTGIPSRARVSPDGRYGAVTALRHRATPTPIRGPSRRRRR